MTPATATVAGAQSVPNNKDLSPAPAIIDAAVKARRRRMTLTRSGPSSRVCRNVIMGMKNCRRDQANERKPIAKHKTHWPVTLACEVLKVSASSYFEHWRRKDTNKPSKPGANKRIGNEALLVHIRAIHVQAIATGVIASLILNQEYLAGALHGCSSRVACIDRLPAQILAKYGQ